MAAVTLLEQAKAIKNPQAQSIVNMFAMEYIINAMLPYSSVTGYDYPFTIFDALPTVNPRDFNADFTSDFGTSSNYRIPWKNYGGKLEIDKALKLGNPAAATTQEMLQVAAIAKKWAAHTIEGAGGVDLLGLNSFLSSFWSGQIVNAGTTASGDLLTLAMMDDLLALVDRPDALFMSLKVNQRLTSLARTSSVHNIQYGVDAFGVQVMKYAGIPVYNMRDGDTGVDILSITEIDGAATNSNTSSVYAIRFGEGAFHGFAPGGEALKVTMSDAGTNYDITRLEKNAGVALDHQRGAARLRYVKQAVA